MTFDRFVPSWLIVFVLLWRDAASAPERPENTLTLYTTIAEKDLPTLLGPFEAEHGIKVSVWRAGTDRILQRTMSEAAAGRYDVDVIHFGSPEMEALARENILLPIDSPVHADLQPGSVPAAQAVGGDAAVGLGAGLQHEPVRREDLPKSYRDLLDPKWKGKLGHRGEGSGLVCVGRRRRAGGGESRASSSSASSPRPTACRCASGHTLLNNMVISGEVPLALTVYNYMPEQAKKKGAPIDWFALEPAIARSNAVGVARRAPHPAAARLFYDYLLGEDAQRSFVSMDYVPSNTKVPSPLAGVKIVQTDPVRSLDEVDKWTKLFEETLLKR